MVAVPTLHCIVNEITIIITHHHQHHHCHQDSMQDVKWSLSPPCIVKKITTIIITSSPAPSSPSSRFNARCKVLEVVAVPTLHCERDQLWSRAVVPGVRLSSFITFHHIILHYMHFIVVAKHGAMCTALCSLFITLTLHLDYKRYTFFVVAGLKCSA